MSRKDGGRSEPRISVHGARFEAGEGGIHVGGNLDASVTASIDGSEAVTLQAKVHELIQALADGGLLHAHDDLADAAETLEMAVRTPEDRRSLISRTLRKIEKHPAVAAGAPATVHAVLAAAQLLAGG